MCEVVCLPVKWDYYSRRKWSKLRVDLWQVRRLPTAMDVHWCSGRKQIPNSPTNKSLHVNKSTAIVIAKGRAVIVYSKIRGERESKIIMYNTKVLYWFFRTTIQIWQLCLNWYQKSQVVWARLKLTYNPLYPTLIGLGQGHNTKSQTIEEQKPSCTTSILVEKPVNKTKTVNKCTPRLCQALSAPSRTKLVCVRAKKAVNSNHVQRCRVISRDRETQELRCALFSRYTELRTYL